MNRLYIIFWVSFAVVLALIVGIIAYDFCCENELAPVASQEGRIIQRRQWKIKNAQNIESEEQIVELKERFQDDVQDEKGDIEPPKTDAEVAYEEWEKVFDGLVKLQNEGNRPSAKQVADFKAAFDKLLDEVKLENIPHAQNLFTDASIDYLTVVLFDTKEPKDVLSSIYYDLLNRPEELKMPIIRKLASDKSHPLSEEAFDLLVMLDDPAIKN